MLLNLYKYIFKELMGPFIMGVLVSTFVLLMFQIIRLTEFIIVQGVNIILVLKLLFFMVVSFLPITVPISFLFSILLTFNRMSGDNEVLALKFSGISTKQLLFPVNIISIIVCLLTLYVSFFEGPWGNKNAKDLIFKIGANKAISRVSEGFLNSNIFKDMMLYSKKIDSKKEEMKDVFIYNGTDPDSSFVIRADKAKLKVDEFTKSTVLKLYNGDLVFLNTKGLKYVKGSFSEYSDLLYKGQDFNADNKIPPSMSVTEIKKEMNMSKKNKNNKRYNEMMVEYQRRFAVPIACIIFGFLGVGFGNGNRRNIKTGAGLLSFLVLLSYWFLYISLTALGIRGVISPLVSAWTPNIIFTVIAFFMLSRAN